MGLRPSSLARPTWVLKGEQAAAAAANKTREPPDSLKSGASELGGGASSAESRRRDREKRPHQRRPRRPRSNNHNHSHNPLRFGYEITDVDAFLSKASLDAPGNIPVVLSSPCLLYQTRLGAPQHELNLPLGMVVNAVFKNQGWLYVQTPHGEEGYVRYGSCLPLGILPPKAPAPCWETHADIFPMPLGNRTDADKVRVGTRSECGGARPKRMDGRDTVSACGERSVDKLYLRATSSARRGAATRHTLVAVTQSYSPRARGGRGSLSVAKGDVVALVSGGHGDDWFFVRNRQGEEGFIPAAVAGHGFL